MVNIKDSHSSLNEKVIRITGLFAPLWREAQEETPTPDKMPLLTHYRSLPVLESIVKNNEISFSNPLFMNDLLSFTKSMSTDSRLDRYRIIALMRDEIHGQDERS
uniref:hypothetical protein n=1 Tax=unclassified Caballeronia TaxID=2646786 RepID=UPI0020284630